MKNINNNNNKRINIFEWQKMICTRRILLSFNICQASCNCASNSHMFTNVSVKVNHAEISNFGFYWKKESNGIVCVMCDKHITQQQYKRIVASSTVFPIMSRGMSTSGQLYSSFFFSLSFHFTHIYTQTISFFLFFFHLLYVSFKPSGGPLKADCIYANNTHTEKKRIPVGG